MKPFNAVMLMKETGEPILILESQTKSKRVLKRCIMSEFRYYNNREGYGAVKLRFYTIRG